MSEEDRIEIPDETAEAVAAQEPDAASASGAQSEPGTEAAAEVELSRPPGEEDPPEAEAAEGGPAHGLSGATLEAMSRTDPQSVAKAEEERTKWERRRAEVRERFARWYSLYMADGGFKLGISLVTAVIAAAIIVIAGIFSDRQLGVVFWRAVIGFFVSGVFMGGVLYWLDRIGIPLFISKHEEQIQMEWLSEAEESAEEGEQAESGEEAAEEETTSEEDMEELMPQEGDEAPTEGTENPETAQSGGEEETAEQGENGAAQTENAESGDESSQENSEAEERQEDMGGLENVVLDDAFSSEGADGEENEEPPTFAPMTADNLETLNVPEA